MTPRNRNGAAVHEIDPLAARRAAAAVRGIASPLYASAAAPLWRSLGDESALWFLTPPPRGRGLG